MPCLFKRRRSTRPAYLDRRGNFYHLEDMGRQHRHYGNTKSLQGPHRADFTRTALSGIYARYRLTRLRERGERRAGAARWWLGYRWYRQDSPRPSWCVESSAIPMLSSRLLIHGRDGRRRAERLSSSLEYLMVSPGGSSTMFRASPASAIA